jgi:diguanylate cyclase (GGDEF)-like protein
MPIRDTPAELAPLGSVIDSVTGLPARALFFDHLQLALAQLDRHATSVAVLVVNVDNFKLVNDALGPDAGDLALRVLGRRVKRALRPTDTVARLGADEFGVICVDIGDARDAVAVAERLCAAARGPVEAVGSEVLLTASVGIAVALTPGVAATDIVRDATVAVHRAKERGPGTCEFFDPALRERLLQRLETESGLRRALDQNELRVHYQPQFDLATGQVVALEALVRWQHPRRGLLLPGEFISVAEECGLIVPLGAWVLQTACIQASRWRTDGCRPFELAVNVSARQIEEPDFVDTVARALEHSGLPPTSLCLEVTESALMMNPEVALDALAAAKSLGVKVAIDDFGIGFSSLGQLRDLLPIHQLKVDRSFTATVASDPRSRSIFAAVVLMATGLGLEAVAEGVETADQLAELSAIGCALAQGFYLAGTQPPDGVPALLRAGNSTLIRRPLLARS